MGRSENPKIGVYIIISPTNRIYIGSSDDLVRRIHNYRFIKSVKKQIRLYESLNKYGYENHHFDIIEECGFLEMRKKERKWQEYCSVIGKNGLNCNYVNTDELPKKLLQSTKDKIGLKNKGKIRTQEHKDAVSKAQTGRKHTEEHKRKTGEKCCKKICQYDLKGNYIQEWPSLKEAAKFYNTGYGNISRVLNGTRNKYKNCIWKYKLIN